MWCGKVLYLSNTIEIIHMCMNTTHAQIKYVTYPHIALTPGRIFAFTLDLVKIRPGIDCMLKNKPPSLMTHTLEVVPRVSQAVQLIKLL